jgi:transposase InsO family protein
VFDGRHQHLWCERVARELDALVRIYAKPACIVSDNGTEFTSRAILKWAGDNKVDWHYIDPGKPRQNAFIENFNGNLRAVQLLLGHTRMDSTVRYLGVELEDALAISEAIEM